MLGIDLLDKNVLSRELVKDWFTQKMIDSLLVENEVPEDFKAFMLEQTIDNEKLSVFIDANPRGLFDLFDEHNIFIEIIMYPDNTFTCKIGNQATTKSWKTRKEAEAFAIEAAIEILESNLAEARMNIIGQNGNTGEHYDEVIE